MSFSTAFLKDLDTIKKNTIGLEDLENKTVLVTGATGQIGSFIVQSLSIIGSMKNLGLSIIAVGRNEGKFSNKFSDILKNGNIKFVQQDFQYELNWDFHTDYIIHAASNADPKSYMSDPVGTMNGNYIATLNILNYAKEQNVDKVVFISTGEVYGEIDDTKPIDETTSGYINSMKVRSCYPISKRATETLCISFMYQFGIDISIARLAHIFGPNFSNKDSRVASQFLKNASERNDLTMYSEGKQIRSYTYISDCVSGILTVLLRGENGEAYNVSNTENAISLHDFCYYIAEVAGVQLKTVIANEEEEKLKTSITHAVLSDYKLKKLGWEPVINVKNGIKNTLKILEGTNK